MGKDFIIILFIEKRCFHHVGKTPVGHASRLRSGTRHRLVSWAQFNFPKVEVGDLTQRLLLPARALEGIWKPKYSARMPGTTVDGRSVRTGSICKRTDAFLKEYSFNVLRRTGSLSHGRGPLNVAMHGNPNKIRKHYFRHTFFISAQRA